MKKWYRLSLFNLVILAFLGVLLRFKNVFSLPLFDYKNLLHGHSHFAFSGWITFLLQILIVEEFTKDYKHHEKFWDRFFSLSSVINYAMAASFIMGGYNASSIALSTAGLFLSYVYC